MNVRNKKIIIVLNNNVIFKRIVFILNKRCSICRNSYDTLYDD